MWSLATKRRGLRYHLKGLDYRKVVLHAICAPVVACVQVALPLDAGALEDAQMTGPQECFDRPEEKAYLADAQSRILKQWTTSADDASNQNVVLQFSLNHDGSVLSVKPIGSNDPKLVGNGVKAIRAASPVAVMSKRVSCLAGIKITARFSPPSSKASGAP